MSIFNGTRQALQRVAFDSAPHREPSQPDGVPLDALRARWVRSALRMLPLDDVAERGQALRQIAEASEDVWWLYEPAGRRFLYVSPAYERRWKHSAAALYIDASQWVGFVHPDDREQVAQAFERLGTGEGFSIEYRTTSASGEERWIAERAFAVSGGALRMAGVSTDVTVHKRRELELLQVDRCKDEFLATLGHELRGPLQPIRFASRLLAQSHPQPGPEHKAIAIIDRQIGCLARLVDELLDVARIRHGRIVLQTETVRLSDALTGAVEANRELIEQKHLQVEIRLPERPVAIVADPMRLAQVFGNLLHNASKWSAVDGAIWLTVTAEPGSRQVVVSVRDFGMGIEPARIESLFDFLAQEEAPANRAHGGLGVGLSVVRALTELHGGTVTARSDGMGRGSEFIVTLPAGAGA